MERAPSFSLRSTKLRWSNFFEQRSKVHCINKGYEWVPRTRGFAENPKEGNSGNRSCRVEKLPTHSSTLKEVGILSTLVLVSILLLIFGLKGWNVLRVYLGKKMPKTPTIFA